MGKNQVYYEKMYAEYLKQFSKLHAATVEKICKNELRFQAGNRKKVLANSKTTNRGVTIYLYSNSGKTHYIAPRQEDINIRPGAAIAAIGVFVDGKLCGVYAFSASPTLSKWDCHIDTPTMYLLSDFPVEPTDYDRLAKLILYAALSKESQLIAERMVKKCVCNLVTTAFSKNPVSMKYRGLFKILNRKEQDIFTEDWAKDIDPANAYYKQKFQINYGAAMGGWTLAEGLELWKKKHSQRTGKKELA